MSFPQILRRTLKWLYLSIQPVRPVRVYSIFRDQTSAYGTSLTNISPEDKKVGNL